ncbi:MAG: ATP-binding protein [bacterium]|nr:ATP-binding protein [bacterium]
MQKNIAEGIELDTIQNDLMKLFEGYRQEKENQAETQKALLNILDDYDREKMTQQAHQSALMNILDDYQDAKEKAEQSQKAKEQFLASMSHEIRTPLNGIIGFTKILLRNEMTEKQKPQLDAIKTSSDILLVLINDILDLAKIEAGKMNIETTELKLSELVNSILGSFELRFQEKELKINKSFDGKIPEIVIGDPVRINQILLNLISNSVKFTESGGNIGIKVILESEDDKKTTVKFIVSDTGIGIPTEKLSTIFESFTQSSSDTARRFGGTGLGLSIVKRLVELMNGTVAVQSKLDEGSVFTITLPLQKTSATAISSEMTSKVNTTEIQSLGKLTILLVEDIPINQFLAQTILHDFGFTTDTAENGKIAIELLQKNDYDIVLMDLMMPEMNGFEATRFIRTQMTGPKSKIPIIALTADVTKADLDKCTKVGMNEYVSKPINETDLLNKISSLIKKDRLLLNEIEVPQHNSICNFDYLKSHSPNNPKFVSEILQMFLKQTPGYVLEMKRCMMACDWHGLQAGSHKVRPSIALMGMPKEVGLAAQKIEEYCRELEHIDRVPALFIELENSFELAYAAIQHELLTMEPDTGRPNPI